MRKRTFPTSRELSGHFVGHCWELSGGKSIVPYCWDPVGKSLSHIVGSCRSFFSYCWKSSQGGISHVVASWWEVTFLILLEVKAGSGKSLFACRVSYRVQINEKVVSTYCWESVGSARFSHGLESGGRSLSRTVGSCRAENQFFHIVGIRWEDHFLTLLGVVGHFSHIVGSQVKVEKSLFACCWELVESRVSHIVGS